MSPKIKSSLSDLVLVLGICEGNLFIQNILLSRNCYGKGMEKSSLKAGKYCSFIPFSLLYPEILILSLTPSLYLYLPGSIWDPALWSFCVLLVVLDSQSSLDIPKGCGLLNSIWISNIFKSYFLFLLFKFRFSV